MWMIDQEGPSLSQLWGHACDVGPAYQHPERLAQASENQPRGFSLNQ